MKMKKKIWIIIGIAAVCLIAGALYFFLGGQLTKEYDGPDVLVETYAAYYDDKPYLSSKYEYDEDGNATKITNYSSGTISHWNDFEYDNGNVIKQTLYTSDETVNQLYVHEYDQSGNRVKSTFYDGDGTVMLSQEFEYDDRGNLIKLTTIDDDDVRYRHEFEYDESGNRTKETQCNSDGTVEAYSEFVYDSDGNRIKDIYYSHGDLPKQTEYEYDKSGNVTKNISYDSDGSVSSLREYKYEYDKNGNMIKRTQLDENGKNFYTEEYVYMPLGEYLAKKYISPVQ